MADQQFLKTAGAEQPLVAYFSMEIGLDPGMPTYAGGLGVLAGDTVPCEGLDRLCEGADVLVHTVIRADLVQAIPLPRLQDILDYHSSVEQAAQTAARNGVGTLVLTHYVPPLLPGAEDEWRAKAVEHFDGRVEVGNDLHVVSIGP